MHSSFRAFAANLIDYAGIFPPALLPLEVAFRNYLQYKSERDGWMLSRFICSADRLNELGEQLVQAPDHALPVHLSVLVGRRPAGSHLAALEEDLDRIVHFVATHGGKIEISLLEASLVDEQSDPEAWFDFVGKSCGRVAFHAPPATELFFELPGSSLGSDSARRVIRTIAGQTRARAGVKIRCGGESPASIPSVRQVAWTIATCRDYAVPLKATAGLHQPFRHHDERLQLKLHGFVNLFAAALLARSHRLEVETIGEILEEEDPTRLFFGKKELQWNQYRISTDEIAAYRQSNARSFGSCSFDEPREGLATLGLLTRSKENR